MKDILITATQIEEWKNRENELEEELALIRQRLNAIALFTDMPSSSVSPLDNLSLADAIMAVVEETKMPMPSSAILAELKKRSYPEPKLGKHNSYFYSVIKRLVEKDMLTKKDGEYRLVQNQPDLRSVKPAERLMEEIIFPEDD